MLAKNVTAYLQVATIENDIQMVITSVDTLAFDDEFLKNVDIINISNGTITN